jgi:hypothetical protein
MKRLVPKSELVQVQGAGIQTKLKNTSMRVRQLRILAGPRPDGTANTDTIYVGDVDVDVKEGDPLGPGQYNDYEAKAEDEFFDLSDFFIISATAGQVARISYLRHEDRQ